MKTLFTILLIALAIYIVVLVLSKAVSFFFVLFPFIIIAALIYLVYKAVES